MDINGVSYRNIEGKDNKEIANIIRRVFRDFGIDRPGTVYYDSARSMGYRQLYLESLPELSKAVAMYLKSGFTHINHALGNSGHFGCNIWMIKEL